MRLFFRLRIMLCRRNRIERAVKTIKEELDERVEYFKENDQLLEAQRISERTNFDIEMLKETGFLFWN